MPGTLVLAILTVRSSYLQNAEEPIGNEELVPDTLQWWISSSTPWRIRTYAIDHDIHTHEVGAAEGLVEFVLAQTEKHFGDILLSQHVIKLHNAYDENEVRLAFETLSLAPRVEIADGRFAFWKPDDAEYRSQSVPEAN